MKAFLVLVALAIATSSAKVANLANAAGGTGRAVGIHPKDRFAEPEDNIEGRIINGYGSHEGKVPYIVGLSFNKNGAGWWCGGSIIGHTWIVTAAHCTDGTDSVTIYFGALNRLEAKFTHWVSRNNFIQHPWYNPNFYHNDIALIRTPHVDFWHAVNKIALPSFNNRNINYASWWALTAGWGSTADNSPVTGYLNCADLQIISNQDCRSYYAAQWVTDHTICTTNSAGRSTCKGDSGGPLVVFNGNYLVGVTSFGPDTGCSKGPAAFTRVTGYLEWIRDHTGIAYY